MLAARANGAAVVRFRLPQGVDASVLPLPGDAEITDGLVSFRTGSPTHVLAPLVAWASERGEELDALTVTRPTLEDVYLELTDGSPA